MKKIYKNPLFYLIPGLLILVPIVSALDFKLFGQQSFLKYLIINSFEFLAFYLGIIFTMGIVFGMMIKIIKWLKKRI